MEPWLAQQISMAVQDVRDEALRVLTEVEQAAKAVLFQYEEVGRTLNRHTDGQVHA